MESMSSEKNDEDVKHVIDIEEEEEASSEDEDVKHIMDIEEEETVSSEDDDTKHIMDIQELDGTSSSQVLSPRTVNRYNNAYDDFQQWNKLHGATPISEDVLLKYFSKLAEKGKPSTMVSYYSMLKTTLRSKDNIDISTWTELNVFIKKQYEDYKPVKSTFFTKEEIEKFLNEAPDEWLDVKVNEKKFTESEAYRFSTTFH